MRLACLAVVVASLVNLSGMTRADAPSSQSPNASPAQPATPTPSGPSVQKVRIVVAPAEQHQQQCKGGKYQPVDILVDANPKNNLPSHCVMGAVLDHGSAHKYDATILKLSYKARDSVLWSSDAEFQITAIEPHDDKNAAAAPKNPFVRTLPNKPSKTVESGPIVEASVNHRYKITFTVNGRVIDPDLWCNP